MLEITIPVFVVVGLALLAGVFRLGQITTGEAAMKQAHADGFARGRDVGREEGRATAPTIDAQRAYNRGFNEGKRAARRR